MPRTNRTVTIREWTDAPIRQVLARLALFELTSPYVEKPVDPALMTFKDYHDKYANPAGKFHGDAYDSTLADLNSYRKASDFPKLINRFTANGLGFELRQKAEDRWSIKYVKHDQEGNHLRDANGELLYMSQEETEALYPGERRYRYWHAIVETEGGQIVAVTENEWGALLVMVASEYRSFGLGTRITEYHRTLYPNANSGGFTNAGYENLRRVHANMVRKYLSQGVYSHLVRKGVLTAAQVKQIVASVPERKAAPSQRNLNVSNPKDWLYHVHDGNGFLYHKGVYDIPAGELSTSGFWEDRYILGYVHTLDSSPPAVYRLYGATDVLKAHMAELTLSAFPGEKIRFTEEDSAILLRHSKATIHTGPSGHRGEVLHWVEEDVFPLLSRLNALERRYRKERDAYDEVYFAIQELAASVGERKGS